MNTFIYSLSDPRTGAIRYVGQSSNLKARLQAHKHARGSGPRFRWLMELKALWLTPIIEPLDEVPMTERGFWEQHWIQVCQGWGFDLLNQDNGGLGSGRLRQGSKTKISESLKGRKNIALSRRVCAYDGSGKLVHEFPSLADAERAGISCHSNICRAMRNGTMAGGFYWKYP